MAGVGVQAKAAHSPALALCRPASRAFRLPVSLRVSGAGLAHRPSRQRETVAVVHETAKDPGRESGDPICLCHRTIGACEVRMVERARRRGGRFSRSRVARFGAGIAIGYTRHSPSRSGENPDRNHADLSFTSAEILRF